MAFTGADAPANTISGFAPGDLIDITDLKESSVSPSFTPNGDGGVLTLTGTQIGSNDPETVELNFSGTSGNFVLERDAGGGTEIAICYLRGTRLLTPEGNLPIESLAPGDRLLTRFGGVRRITWIGRQSFGWHVAQWRPVRICAGALEPGVPSRDLLVSPGHSMLLGGQLVLAETLVNGITVRRETQGNRLNYFQVEFETHDCVLAEGAWSETYADAPGLRAQFHNAAEYAALYPHVPPARELLLCAPRPERGEGLEAALDPIVARAAAEVAPGRLEGFIDSVTDWQVHGWALDAEHKELPVLLEIVHAGEVLGTALAYERRDDLRSAGKGDGSCAFTFHAPRRLHLDALRVRRACDGAELGFSASLREVA